MSASRGRLRLLPAIRLRRVLARTWHPALVGLIATAVLAPGTAAFAEPSIDQIERKITAESHRLERIVEQYNKVSEELKSSQLAAQRLAATIQPLAADLAIASQRVAKLAAHAYKGGALAEFAAVLGADGPTTIIDRLLTLDQLAKVERAQIDAFTDTKTRHDVEATRLAALIGDQTAQRRTLTEQKAKLDADLAKLYSLRRQAYGRATAPRSSVQVSPPYLAGKAGKAVSYAYGALGKPYVWGAAGPSGYDCSGLTSSAWRAAGVSLPHNAAMQWNALPKIGRASLQPGDLVFYAGLGHVGIYVGNNQIIHAPTFGEQVKLANVNVMPPYGYARPS